MSIPNPLKARLQGKRNVWIYENLLEQVGTDIDHLALIPEFEPEQRDYAPETLTDSNTYFIDAVNGLDGNAGTEANPKQTLQGALTAWDASQKPYFCLLGSTYYVYVEDVNLHYPLIQIFNDTGHSSKIRLIKRTVPGGFSSANAYFVDFDGGDDSGAGTAGDPFKTLQKACDVAYSDGAVDRDIVILMTDTMPYDYYFTEESVELLIPYHTSDIQRNIYVLFPYTLGADPTIRFKTGTSGMVKYKYKERTTSSANKDWKQYFYLPGKFQQSSKETLYASCRDGANGRVFYSTDGLTWTVVTTNPIGAKCVGFAYQNYSGTDYLFLGTLAGVYRSTDGLTWTITGLSTGSHWDLITWNSNVIASGGSGMQRTANGGTSWTSISTNNCRRLAAIGNYLYFYDATLNIIRKVNTSWSLSTHATISEISNVRSMVAFNGKLYLIGDNSTTSTVYFIEIDTDGNYQILYSRSYISTDINKIIISAENRLYLPNLTGLNNVSVYDGTSFKEIGTTTGQFSTGYWGFKGRLYFNFDSVTAQIKYFLIDCLNIIDESLGYGITNIEGLILDGNNSKASSGLRNADYTEPSLSPKHCKFQKTFYSGASTTLTSEVQVRNCIFHTSQNGLITEKSSIQYSLFYAISEVAAYLNNETFNYVHNCTFDYVNTGVRGALQIRDSILSRTVKIVENITNDCQVLTCLVQFPYTYVNAVLDDSSYPSKIGTPIFRNRDAIEADLPDYRLQAKWVRPDSNEDRYYMFSSAGVGMRKLSSTAFDVGAYKIRRFNPYVIVNDWDYTWECDFNPDETALSIAFNNLNELITVNGIKKPSFEGSQNKIVLPWQPKTTQEMSTIRDLYTILRRNEKSRLTINHWYDLSSEDVLTYAKSNDLGLFSGPSVVGSGGILARFNYEEMWLSQYEHSWIEDEFKGWLVYISYIDFVTSERLSRFYKIIRNTHNTLYLVDTEGMYQTNIPVSSPPEATNNNDDLIFIIGAMDVRVNTDKLKSNLASWYRKAQAPVGTLEIEFVEV